MKNKRHQGEWHMGHIALFGAILMSNGIIGKEKTKLKKMMFQALSANTQPMNSDDFYLKHPELCN